MKCLTCNKDKLMKEYPEDTLSEQCSHPPRSCLLCLINHLSKVNKCPYKDCPVQVNNASNLVQLYKDELDQLYPAPPESIDFQPETVSTSSDKMINIVMLTGNSASMQFNPSLTIGQLKDLIKQRLNVDQNKQLLVYNGTNLEEYDSSGKLMRLSDYNVQPFTTIHLMILLYAIPENFNHVIFDLFWGYPSRGRDYLDASCLVYSGKTCVSTIDYRSRHYVKAVWHSGDVMDDASRQGHHTIEVQLKNIPADINHLYFTLSAWNSPTIMHFPNPSLKFFEASNKTKDLCKTTFVHARNSQAVIMCSMSRTQGGQWRIVEGGTLSNGNAKNYKPLQSTIQGMIPN